METYNQFCLIVFWTYIYSNCKFVSFIHTFRLFNRYSRSLSVWTNMSGKFTFNWILQFFSKSIVALSLSLYLSICVYFSFSYYLLFASFPQIVVLCGALCEHYPSSIHNLYSPPQKHFKTCLVSVLSTFLSIFHFYLPTHRSQLLILLFFF